MTRDREEGEGEEPPGRAPRGPTGKHGGGPSPGSERSGTGEEETTGGAGPGPAEAGGEPEEVTSLEELLDRLCDASETAGEGDRVTLGHALDMVGRRSFGTIILVGGLITVMPLVGDIPGVPTIMGIVVILTAGQLMLRRDHVWLPDFLLRRSVSDEKLEKAIGWMRRPAGWLDRVTRRRLPKLVRGPGAYVIAGGCILIAAATPAMELVPFSANGAGAALVAFGLALIVHDGLLAAIAFVLTAGTMGAVGWALLGG